MYDFQQESPKGPVVFAGRFTTEYRAPSGQVIIVKHRPKVRSRKDRAMRRRRVLS